MFTFVLMSIMMVRLWQTYSIQWVRPSNSTTLRECVQEREKLRGMGGYNQSFICVFRLPPAKSFITQNLVLTLLEFYVMKKSSFYFSFQPAEM